MIKKENLKDVLKYLNFEENSEIFTKSFDNFELKVDFEHEKFMANLQRLLMIMKISLFLNLFIDF